MNSSSVDLVVIGGGAAGFFAAIQLAEMYSGATISILEKTGKLLSKVKVSGGGRCNVTHHCFDPIGLSRHYPRGEKQLKSLFKKYQAKNVADWFQSKGVKLKTEDDGRMFPVSDNSQTIIDCFLNEAERNKIRIEVNFNVTNIAMNEGGSFTIMKDHDKYLIAKHVLIAIGGNSNPAFYKIITSLGHEIASPIPSLFTFNDSQKKFADLMGISVSGVEVKIAGTKLSNKGSVLITHWGLSGPAVIKLSAWAADYLHKQQYRFTVLINWIDKSEEETKESLNLYKQKHPKQKIAGNPLYNLPQRLWRRLCEIADIDEGKIWGELSQRNFNKLMESLIRSSFEIKGKTTFKDEFVTCGGVLLNDVDLDRMESKKVKNLFFAGEVLNIDGETGGFNFQAAWTTAYVAADSIRERLSAKQE